MNTTYVDQVDDLVDDPTSYSKKYPINMSVATNCLRRKGFGSEILGALKYGMLDHDWYTQRFSSKRRHTSALWLKALKAVADCIVGRGAGYLAELHVALDIISKRKGVEREDLMRDLQERGISDVILNFINENYESIKSSIIAS